MFAALWREAIKPHGEHQEEETRRRAQRIADNKGDHEPDMQLTGNGAAQCQHIAKRVENGRDKAEENKTAPMRYGEIIEGQINAGEIENLQRDKGTKSQPLARSGNRTSHR
jgi:hypothetical protein